MKVLEKEPHDRSQWSVNLPTMHVSHYLALTIGGPHKHLELSPSAFNSTELCITAATLLLASQIKFPPPPWPIHELWMFLVSVHVHKMLCLLCSDRRLKDSCSDLLQSITSEVTWPNWTTNCWHKGLKPWCEDPDWIRFSLRVHDQANFNTLIMEVVILSSWWLILCKRAFKWLIIISSKAFRISGAVGLHGCTHVNFTHQCSSTFETASVSYHFFHPSLQLSRH